MCLAASGRAHGLQDAPSPRRSAIVALCLVSASHTYSLSAFFAYAGFLAVDLGWSVDLDHTGVVVGILGAVLPASRIPVSIMWGLAMDRWGRRPCLMLTCGSLMAGGMIFPFMTHWWAAVLIRFVLLGMGNGWVTLMAVCCAELGGPTHQAAILGYVIGAGGAINLIGPGLGGFTYHVFGSPYPALLPSVIGALLAGIAGLDVWFFFPETRPPPQQPAGSPQTANAQLPAPDQAPLSPAMPPALPVMKQARSQVPPVQGPSLWTALRTYPLPLLVCLRCLLGALGFCMMTLIPLWSIASTDVGGLALDNEELGVMLSSSAAISLLWSTLLMARFINRFGARRAMVASAATQMLCILSLPRIGSSHYVLVITVNAVLQMANTTCFTSTIAAVNNVCSQFPHRRGSINGVSARCPSPSSHLSSPHSLSHAASAVYLLPCSTYLRCDAHGRRRHGRERGKVFRTKPRRRVLYVLGTPNSPVHWPPLTSSTMHWHPPDELTPIARPCAGRCLGDWSAYARWLAQRVNRLLHRDQHLVPPLQPWRVAPPQLDRQGFASRSGG